MTSILLIILALIAVSSLWFYGWTLVFAITVSVTLIPFVVIPVVEIYRWVGAHGEASLSLSDAFAIAGLFAFFGWLFYMLFVAPIYLVFKAFGVSLAVYFPLAVALVVTLLFFILAEQRLPLWSWGMVALCGYLHAWLILGIVKSTTLIP